MEPSPIIPTPTIPTAPKQNSFGSTFGVVLVLLIVIVGALYFWGERIARDGGIQATSTPVELE